MDEKIIGILGGMGPEATADLYYRIIRATPAKKDRDHPRTIIYSNTKVPDRTAAIIGEGPSPLGEMVRLGRRWSKRAQISSSCPATPPTTSSMI